MKFSIANLGLLLTIALSLSACANLGGSYTGQVLDADTNAPIGDVFVVAKWSGDEFQGVDSTPMCYHMEAGKTAADGTFRLPAWIAPPLALFLMDKKIYVTAYKPGYLGASPYMRGHTIYLKISTGNSETRNEYLRRYVLEGGCEGPEPDFTEKYKALCQEARELPEPDKNLVEVFCAIARTKATRISEEAN